MASNVLADTAAAGIRLMISQSAACGDCSHGLMSHENPQERPVDGVLDYAAGKCTTEGCTCPEFMDFGDHLAPKLEDDISEQEKQFQIAARDQHSRLLRAGFRRRAKRCTYCGDRGMTKKITRDIYLCVTHFEKQNPGLIDASPQPQI